MRRHPYTIGSSFAECDSIYYWQQLYGTRPICYWQHLCRMQFHLLLAVVPFTISSNSIYYWLQFYGHGSIYYWQQLCGARSHMLLAVPASWQLFTTKLRCAVNTCNWEQLTQQQMLSVHTRMHIQHEWLAISWVTHTTSHKWFMGASNHGG